MTDRLYGGTTEHRLRQEILLGIGGVRALREWSRLTGDPAPEVFHTNEGHAGFLGLERIRELTVAEDGPSLDFDTALEVNRAGTVFTTHTPVPAGIDRFPRDLIEQYFSNGGPLPGVPTDRVLSLGAEDYEPATPASSTWPSWASGSRSAPTASPSCTATSAAGCSTGCGRPSTRPRCRSPRSPTACTARPGWPARSSSSAAGWAATSTPTPTSGTSSTRSTAPTSGRSSAPCGSGSSPTPVDASASPAASAATSPAQLGWVESALDPDVLTIGFARRVPSYKRLTLMLRDPDRLKRLLLHPERPIQLVIAGKSHPADEGGKD